MSVCNLLDCVCVQSSAWSGIGMAWDQFLAFLVHSISYSMLQYFPLCGCHNGVTTVVFGVSLLS